MYNLILILNLNGSIVEQQQPFFHSFETCTIALETAKKDPDVITAVCREEPK